MHVSGKPIILGIWLFINVLYGVTQHLVFLLISIGKACDKLFINSSMLTTDDFGFMMVSEHVKKFVKVPGHFAVLIGDEDVSIEDLASIVVWCCSAGISCVSLYDYRGILKAADTKLCSALQKMGKVGSLCLNKIVWGNKDIPNYIPDKQCNGTNGNNMSTQTLHVNVFSLSDSKASFVDVAKSLLLSTNTQIDVKLVGSVLHKSLNIPEVDVAVCCGKTFCTYGFLPWHTRLTELSQLPSHHNLDVKYFISLLDTYSKCQQRFGK